MKRTVYLKMKSLSEARRIFADAIDWPSLRGTETIATADALGRITAEPVFARYSSPSYHGAAMDGYAVKADHTYGASEEHPLRLQIHREAHPINTGQPLPEGTNAVIMIEHVQHVNDDLLEIVAAAFPWQHVRRVGEDVVTGELILPHNHRLAAVDLAALLTSGVFRIPVRRRPRVAILATGTELVDWRDAEHEEPGSGAIIESNSTLLAGMVREAGGEPVVLARQPDELESVQTAIDRAVDDDVELVLINAGVSAGSEDFTSHAVGALGEVLVHGVKAMPGKPTLLGRVRGKPVVGTPGYPVSAWVCFDQFVRPAIERLLGSPESSRERVPATPGRRLPSKLGHEEFLRVHVGRVGNQVVALPLKRGAGTITSLTRADGILRVAAESEGCEVGDPVEVELLRTRPDIERTLVVVGSHDITLDLIADRLPRHASGFRLSASNVGSLAGLLALRDGRSHLGGTHLLDPETGEYNVSYIERYLPDLPVRLVTLAHREQGLIVRPGNPKGISGLADLGRDDVVFINRQVGSGTRVLLDYHLGKHGVDPGRIQGYEVEEYTHMAVAVQVISGGADVGLGILAAARALGLDFVPVATERYDLCIPDSFIDDPRAAALLDILQQAEFREAVFALGGYHVDEMGRERRVSGTNDGGSSKRTGGPRR
jgi:putative molybdopterin biosynthesis protein